MCMAPAVKLMFFFFLLKRQFTQFDLSELSLNYVKPIPLQKVGTAIIGLNHPIV